MPSSLTTGTERKSQETAAERVGDTIAAKIADVLRSRILSGTSGLQPGARINIDRLAADFGVSVTPIKDGLRLLVDAGLVVYEQRRGFYVIQPTARGLAELAIVREGLEVWALRLVDGRVPPQAIDEMALAVERAAVAAQGGNLRIFVQEDEHYHCVLADLPDNQMLSWLYRQAVGRAQIHYLFSPNLDGSSVQATREHRDLLGVLACGDLAIIDAALRRHWAASRKRLIERYEAYVAASGQAVSGEEESGTALELSGLVFGTSTSEVIS